LARGAAGILAGRSLVVSGFGLSLAVVDIDVVLQRLIGVGTALAAIGTQTDIARLARSGPRRWRWISCYGRRSRWSRSS